MKVYTILRNVVQGIKNTLQEAKNYSDARGDYRVEEGTSGIWTYRKWASGIAECWGEHSETKAPYVILPNNWYGFYTASVSLPFTFLQKPKVNYSMQMGASLSMTGTLLQITTSTVCGYGMAYGASGSCTITADFNVKGLWKAFEQVGGVIAKLLARLSSSGKVVTA